MTIEAGDLLIFKSAVINDTDSNGGVMSSISVTSGAASNLFPAAGAAERLAGSVKYRKGFYKVSTNNSDSFLNPKIFWDNYTPAIDAAFFFPATQTDIQDDITGSEDKYGCGQLHTNVAPGASTIVVDTESDTIVIYRVGETIRISDKLTFEDAGTEEYGVIDAVNYVGAQATIDLVDNLVNGYSASDTRVMSVLEPADVKVTFDTVVIDADSGAGIDFDVAFGNNAASVEQVWVLTKMASGDWNVNGQNGIGDLGDFDADGSGGIAPNNPDYTLPYFTIPADAIIGTFIEDDTVTFSTHPAAVPVWIEHVILAGASAFGNNTATLVMRGEALV